MRYAVSVLTFLYKEKNQKRIINSQEGGGWALWVLESQTWKKIPEAKKEKPKTALLNKVLKSLCSVQPKHIEILY